MEKPEVLIDVPKTDDHVQVTFYVNGTCDVFFSENKYIATPSNPELAGWELADTVLVAWALQKPSRVGELSARKMAPEHYSLAVRTALAERILLGKDT